MNLDGQFGRVPTVHFERLLPGPVERVWEFLTTTERLPAWFGNGTFEPREGGAVTLMDGHIRGVVTQWQPPRKLAYTWNVFDPGDTVSAYPESYLTFELEPRGDKVYLTLTHLPIPERFQKQNAMGWHTFLDLLEGSLRSDEPQTREMYLPRNAQRYGIDLDHLES